VVHNEFALGVSSIPGVCKLRPALPGLNSWERKESLEESFTTVASSGTVCRLHVEFSCRVLAEINWKSSLE